MSSSRDRDSPKLSLTEDKHLKLKEILFKLFFIKSIRGNLYAYLKHSQCFS